MTKNTFTEEQKLEIMYTLAEISILGPKFIKKPYVFYLGTATSNGNTTIQQLMESATDQLIELRKECLLNLINRLAECMFDENEMQDLTAIIESSTDLSLADYKNFMESKLHQIMNGGDK